MHCSDMSMGDVLVYRTCGLELKVEQSCHSERGEPGCREPIKCCGEEMIKKQLIYPSIMG